jgi:5-methylcytosine-specific restriction endonuclease McrA
LHNAHWVCIVYLMRKTAGRKKHDSRKGRESLSKRLGKTARRIKARDGHVCVYCGSDGDGAHLQLDHLTPRSHGGEDVATNICVACRRCNAARQNMTLKQWSAYALAVYGLRFSARSIRSQARRKLPEAA